MARPKLLTTAFVLCGLASTLQAIAFNLFLHFPGYLSDLGADPVQIGVIFGIASVAAIGVRPPMGPFMDRRGRRVVILAGGALNCVVCAAYLAIDSLGPFLYGLRIAHGLAEAALFTALFTLAADLVPWERRTEGLALFGISGMLPIAIGGLLGDAILHRADFDALFWTAFAFAVASLLMSLPLRDVGRGAGGSGEEPSQGFRAVLAQRDLLPLWWIGGTFSLVLASVFVFLKRFVDETGVGTVGGFFAAYSTAALVMRVFFGFLPDRIGPKRVLYPSLAALASGLAVLALAENGRDVAAAGVLAGLGHGYVFPILFGLVVTRTRDADRGSAMAIYTALFDLGVVVGGPLFGAISREAGYAEMYAAAAGLLAAGSLGFAVWDRGR